jgi:adenylate cyclase
MNWNIPISIKLVTVTVTLILAVAVPIALRNSQIFETTFGRSQHDTNAELANSKASEVEGLTLSYLEKIRTSTDLLLQEFASEDERKRALDLVFYRDLDLVSLEIFQLDKGHITRFKELINDKFLQEHSLSKHYVTQVGLESPIAIAPLFAANDHILIRNATLKLNGKVSDQISSAGEEQKSGHGTSVGNSSNTTPLFIMGVPFPDSNGVVRHIALAHIRLDRLQKVFTTSGARSMYLADSDGRILAHSNDRLAIGAVNFSSNPIVQEAISRAGTSMRGQKRFMDPADSTWRVGAYAKTAFGPIVVAQVPEDIILEPARALRHDVFEVTGYVLSIALFFVIIFSLTLTHPIEKLHEATAMIAKGNFNVRAKIRSHDEVGQLAHAFNQMVEGLIERDKIKNIFNKFHGSSVTEDLLKQGELNLGGNRKVVTVLFSDIRDFTKFSEGHTPEEVVEMLNEYFQIMVSVITANSGIVDKFVGDAIMAVWGAPNSTGHDAFFALKASLEMRVALYELNERRASRGHTPIKIGIGLHSGPAISGTIGSLERMEYTVIGDTVNMASRIEASTKAFGADLLVSGDTMNGIEGQYIFEYAGAAEVKGKAEAIGMYKVRGYVDTQGQPIHISTPYSDFEPAHVDKVKIAG